MSEICPCGSGLSTSECCDPIIAGAPPATALALMRSRYSALVKNDMRYLASTLTDDQLVSFDPVEIGRTAADAHWEGLEIKKIVAGSETDDQGAVEFVARYRVKGQRLAHHELAQFVRDRGIWKCSGGEVNPKSPPRRVEHKIGRNDPCSCGSGKKYKKCCGRSAA